MKVRFTAEAKEFVTVAEMPAVRRMIESFKEDESTVKEYAEMAARLISGNNAVEVMQASAEISKNCRVWNAYDDGTGDLDLWVKFLAFDRYKSFYECGAYLSDIWQIGAIDAAELKSRMYVDRYDIVK